MIHCPVHDICYPETSFCPVPNRNVEITVIITCYKHEQYLMRAVSSILNQTFQNFEIIIVNDNPKANLSEYVKLSEKIIVINNSIY